MVNRWRISLILILGILAVSTSAIWIRLSFAAANSKGVPFSLFLAASRLILASLLLLPTWRKFKGINAPVGSYFWAIGAGITLAVHFAAWITSLSHTSIAASTVIVTTNPVWVSLLAWWGWGESISLTTMGGIAIALLGGGVIVGLDSGINMGNNPLLGNCLALIGAWMVSFYLLFGREAQRQGLQLNQYIIIAYTTAALILLPFPLLFQGGYNGYPPIVYFYILLMAVFPQLIGHTAFNWAMNQISATVVTLTILFEPVVASLLGMIVFQEIPPIQVIIGGIIILIGVAVAILGKKS
ncbi:MAG: DMT family transporter [Microcystaceae cyanobacterium]